MKSNKKGCRAVSTVLAVLMLIAIVVIAALVVYAWTMGYIGASTEEAGERISIPSVANDPTDTDLVVYVKNVGEGTVQLREDECLYVNGNLALCSITGVTVWGGLATLDEGETATLTFAGGAALPEEKVDIRVTTVSGKSAEYSGYPSKSTYNPSVLIYFTFDIVDNPQTSGVPFTVTIRALDQYDDLFTGYSGVNDLTYSGGEITPSTTTAFTDGVWTGKVTVTGVATDATIVTSAQSNPSKTGTSNTFNVVYIPVAPTILWNKTYGGPENELAYSVANTSDGGYAIAGTTGSYSPEPKGSSYAWLVKTDASGNMEWNITYGKPIDHISIYSLIVTSDDGYAMVGRIDFNATGNGDFVLIKTDKFGNMEWNQTYGETGDDWAYAVVETSDNGYVITGYNGLLVKTNATGNMEWNQTFAGRFYDLVATSDGGYVLAGSTYALGNRDLWLVKTDAFGVMEWNKTYGEQGDNLWFQRWEWAYSLVETSDGGYAIAGTKALAPVWYDFWLIKTDGLGNEQWNRTYSIGDGNEDPSLVVTPDGGYAIAGYASGDFCLLKTDASGDREWSITCGGTERDAPYSLIVTSDGGYAIAGSTESYGAGGADFWLIKTD